MRIFARITKVDEAKRLVIGRAAQEVVDKDDEVFDYETSKPNFMKWSAEVFAESGGKSYGNMRAMHSNIAAGKITNIDFNDSEKAIDIETKVVDDNEWEKVLEGVYTGFSIGGKYTKKWASVIDEKPCTRYTANPSEISYVDRPCIPTARFYEVKKADGSLHTQAFKGFDTPTGATTGMSEYDQGAKPKRKKKVAKEALEVDDEEARAVKPPKVEVTSKMQKGMCTVAALFAMLRDLTEMTNALEAEQEAEGDASTIYQQLRDKVQELAAIGGKLALEEAAEVADGVLNDNYYGAYMYRMAKGLEASALSKVGRRNSADDLELLQNVHDTVCKLGAACAEGSGAEKDDTHDDEFPGEPRKLEGNGDMKKSAQSDIKTQGSKRGATVTDGGDDQTESSNAADKEKTTAPLGSHGADRGFSSKKAKAKANEDDEDDEDMDDEDEEDEDDEEEEPPKKKSAKAKKSLESRLRKSITNDVIDALKAVGVIPAPAAQAQQLNVTGAPSLSAVGKDGSVSKATSNEDLKKSVSAVQASKLSGEKDDVATLIKASHLHPMSHADLYK